MKGVFLVLGIYSFFLAYGIAQEEIYKATFDGDLEIERFTFSTFLVLAMCISNAIVAYICIAIQNLAEVRKKQARAGSEATYLPYVVSSAVSPIRQTLIKFWECRASDVAIISMTYVCAMIATNLSLTRVNYPTQVLVKSAKMVPVVVGGWLLHGKRYPWYDYLTVVVVTFGLILFNFSRILNGGSGAAQTTSGMVFLFISLLCDGMTGPRQDRLLSRVKVAPLELMLMVNVLAIGWASLATFSVDGTEPLAFCMRHPSAVKLILLFCVSASLGQIFIFKSLDQFGSLYLTLITTTRKFFTVLLSVAWFRHSLDRWQWLAVGAIFSSLAGHAIAKSQDKKKKSH